MSWRMKVENKENKLFIFMVEVSYFVTMNFFWGADDLSAHGLILDLAKSVTDNSWFHCIAGKETSFTQSLLNLFTSELSCAGNRPTGTNEGAI